MYKLIYIILMSLWVSLVNKSSQAIHCQAINTFFIGPLTTFFPKKAQSRPLKIEANQDVEEVSLSGFKSSTSSESRNQQSRGKEAAFSGMSFMTHSWP